MKKSRSHSPASAKGPFSHVYNVDSARDRPGAVELEATEAEQEKLADFLGVVAISKLKATFQIKPLSGGHYEVIGEVSAVVTQNCVVTLEDFETTIREPFAVVFAPVEPEEEWATDNGVVEVSVADESDPPEPLVNGRIDLGAVATEFLALAINPWPRKPGAAFELNSATAAQPPVSPFAALAKLKTEKDSE